MSQTRSIALAAVGYCALFGAALFAWLLTQQPQSLANAVVCAVPALLAALVLGRHRGEPAQLMAKTCVCTLLPPAMLLLWSNEQVPPDAITWPALVAFAVAHVLAFIGFILWAAPRSTRVGAVGTAPLAAAELRGLIASLAQAELGVSASAAPEGGEVTLEYVHDGQPARASRFVLQLEPRTHTLYVRELEGVNAAVPGDAAEAEMRPSGSAGIDPTLPRARRVYGKSSNATFLDPTRLAALQLRIDASGARVTSPLAREADAKHVAYALAALTTRCGWHYQPILFDFQRGA